MAVAIERQRTSGGSGLPRAVPHWLRVNVRSRYCVTLLLLLLLLVSPANTEGNKEDGPCNQENIEEDQESCRDGKSGVAITSDIGYSGQRRIVIFKQEHRRGEQCISWSRPQGERRGRGGRS